MSKGVLHASALLHLPTQTCSTSGGYTQILAHPNCPKPLHGFGKYRLSNTIPHIIAACFPVIHYFTRQERDNAPRLSIIISFLSPPPLLLITYIHTYRRISPTNDEGACRTQRKPFCQIQNWTMAPTKRLDFYFSLHFASRSTLATR